MTTNQHYSQNRALRILAVLFFVGVLVLATLPNVGITSTSTSTASFTPASNQNPMPDVPAGGTVVNITRTYFHTSGLIGVPKLFEWDLPQGGGEENILPSDAAAFQRAGIMFINSNAQSVVHTFAERDPNFAPTSIADLDKHFTAAYLAQAWKDYTGGWRELGRRTEGDTHVIDFELKVDTPAQQGGGNLTATYLGRQIAKLDNGWVMVIRLVAPPNNLELLNRLQAVVVPNFRLYLTALGSPTNWSSITDFALGYVVKFPPTWNLLEGSAGSPYTVVGKIGNETITMTTRVQAATTIQDEAAAQAWVVTAVPKATIVRASATGINGLQGFIVAYSDPDPDGNQRSAVTVLLNGPTNRVFVITQQYSARGLDLSDVNNVNLPPELRQSRESFFIVPTNDLAVTATPMPTVTPASTP